MTPSVGNQSMIKASKYTRAVFAVIRVKKPGLLQKQKRESAALTSWKYLDPSRSEINIFKSFCALVSCQLCSSAQTVLMWRSRVLEVAVSFT